MKEISIVFSIYYGEIPLSSQSQVCYVNFVFVIRTGMVGVPGTASTIFAAVKDVGANVIMISQVGYHNPTKSILIIRNTFNLYYVGE